MWYSIICIIFYVFYFFSDILDCNIFIDNENSRAFWILHYDE